jgi:hypothetical protein
MLDLPQLFGLINYSMIEINVLLYYLCLNVVEMNFWYCTYIIWWLLVLKYWLEYDYVCLKLWYVNIVWWMRCRFEMNKHWCSFGDKVVMVPACVVDGALKEYLRPTRGEIRCKGENLFIFRLLWS